MELTQEEINKILKNKGICVIDREIEIKLIEKLIKSYNNFLIIFIILMIFVDK